jgi:hypothetical protein
MVNLHIVEPSEKLSLHLRKLCGYGLCTHPAFYILQSPRQGKSALVYVDSFPSADGWWTPPLHGEDVAYLWNNSELEKLEELRLLDPKRFSEILKAHGCCSIGHQDLLLSCFEKEEGLQPLHKRRANRHAAGLLGVDPPGPDHADYEWLIATNLKTYFNLDWQWVSPSTN